MKRLSHDGLVGGRRSQFARNRLEILVEPGNPKGITGLSDLARTDIKLVARRRDRFPFGKFTAAGAGRPPGVTVGAGVEGARREVGRGQGDQRGEADVTVVYVTDVNAASTRRARASRSQDAQNVIAEYPIAIVKATKAARMLCAGPPR